MVKASKVGMNLYHKPILLISIIISTVALFSVIVAVMTLPATVTFATTNTIDDFGEVDSETHPPSPPMQPNNDTITIPESPIPLEDNSGSAGTANTIDDFNEVKNEQPLPPSYSNDTTTNIPESPIPLEDNSGSESKVDL